eukprot:scaffold251124_cov32-Tisochrysis_lutea.AAC.5
MRFTTRARSASTSKANVAKQVQRGKETGERGNTESDGFTGASADHRQQHTQIRPGWAGIRANQGTHGPTVSVLVALTRDRAHCPNTWADGVAGPMAHVMWLRLRSHRARLSVRGVSAV